MKLLTELLKLPTISIIIGALISIFTTYINDKLKSKRELKLKRNDDIKRAYCKLSGLNFKLCQLDYSNLEAEIYSIYYKHLVVLYKEDENSFYAKERTRNLVKNEEYINEIATYTQNLYEVFGEIEVLFIMNNRILDSIKKIMDLKPIEIKIYPHLDCNIVDLISWRDNALSSINNLIETGYNEEITTLLNNIKLEISARNKREG